ncbi:MAG: hypothetical protein DMF88_13270 [Acidobacteria bacterium]|nr:MAG: hypothetical protein DMF88_13270 [Acidobacteriota bacterium]
MPRRIDDLRAFAAPRPLGHHHFFGADVVEAILLHRLRGPRDGATEVLAAAQAIAVGIGELGEPLPGEVVGRGGLDQPGRGVAVRVDPA